MRVAALYDIHGNLPALEAVLDQVRREAIDRIVVGGDVFPGPMAQECLQTLLALEIPLQFIRGNGDREVVAARGGRESATLPEQAREAIRWNAEQLDSEDERLIASWAATVSLEIGALGRVLFCHATPRSDTELFTSRTPDRRLGSILEAVDVPLVVCGHTHMQFDRTIGAMRVVNAGSVGMPFGEPGAYWLLLGSDVQFRRTSYDLAEAAERIRASAYPQATEFATRNVLRPPSEDEMLELFSKAEPS